MDGERNDTGSEEALHPNATWWQSDYAEKLKAISLNSLEVASGSIGSSSEHEQEGLASQRASQVLWASGKLAEPIPDGFYFITPERRFKELFDTIPPLDELCYLDIDGLRPSVIIVNTHKDKKLQMLKQLSLNLVKGLGPNPAAIIKKIAALVSDVFKRPDIDGCNMKGALEEVSHAFDNQGIHMLGQIKHGSCCSRAILFKVLADAAGLDSRLMVGLPSEGVMERTDSYKHMSVTVVLDSVELLVDLVHDPGKLVPCSVKAIFLSHVSSIGDSDYMEFDSYNSPVDSTSSLCGFPDPVDFEGTEYAESFQSSSYQHKLEAATNVSGRSLRSSVLQSKAITEHKLNLSHSEPNVVDTFWSRNHKKAVSEQRTANSSPESPSFRRPGRSILGSQKYFFKEYSDNINSSSSADASPVDGHRRRRRRFSMIPEISDEIVRAVRSMSETLKQNQVLKEPVNATYCCSTSKKDGSSDLQENVPAVHRDDQEGLYPEKGQAFNFRWKQANSQKAISLPSSPKHYMNKTSVISETEEIFRGPQMISMLNKVLESSKILNKPLLPFDEWNIDFSEISIGARVGIGFFGEVFRGTWNGIEVAIKVFLEQGLSVENIEDFCNEISILSRIRHPNVILFLGACTKPPRLSIVTEYMEMGSLYYLIHVSGQKKRLSWRRKLKMLCGICRGLMCIHRMNVAHRDLKSANCLVNKHWKVKICDFGLSRFLTTRPMRDPPSAGTPEWMAPELIRNEPFTEKCDIFSLGVIIWELCNLTRPWQGIPSAQVVYAVANDGKRLEIPEGPLGELIADCWAEPNERPCCDEVLSRLIECEHILC